MFNKILLAADGSPYSLRAAEKAIELASLVKEVTIDVVYVIDGNTSKTDVLRNRDAAVLAQHRREKLQPIEELLQNTNITYEINFLRGEPGPTIVDHANSQAYDLVVIGSRGLNKLQEMVLGSVSHKVVKRIDCPVLIVK